MKKWEAYRFILLLLVGGIIFSFSMKLPQTCLEKLQAMQTEQAQEENGATEDNVSQNDIRENDIDDNSVSDNTASDEKMGQEDVNVVEENEQVEESQTEDTHTDDALLEDGQSEEADDQELQGEDSLGEDLQSEEEQDGQSENELGEQSDEGIADATVEETPDNQVANTQVGNGQFVTVEDNYFDDAVFIGDSRTVSLYSYAGWENADFYCSSGMRLDGVFGEPDPRFKDGNWKENIYGALQRKQYGKVYIMLGINDMGVGDLELFQKLYSGVIETLRQLQPNAIIYIQGIMKVTNGRDSKGDYINNEAISVRNDYLKTLDNGSDIIYLDVNSVVCDSTGALSNEYSFDGVHLYAKYVYIWTDYLKCHAK